MSGVSLLSLAALIGLLYLISSATAAKRAWPKEMDDDPPVEQKRKYDNPKDVPWIHEGDIYTLRMQHDILAVLVIHPFECPKCVVGHQALIEAHDKILRDETGTMDALLGGNPVDHIKFAVLDAEDEAPEFIALFHDVTEDNYRQKIPCLLIFKKYHQEVLKKPPIMFTFTESNLKKNLAPLLVRLAGPDIKPVESEQELLRRMTSRASHRVSAVIWADNVTKSQSQVAMEGRFDIHWSIVTSPLLRAALAPKLNPDQNDVVFYFYKGAYGEDHISDAVKEVEDLFESRGLRIADVTVNETRAQRRDDKERRALKNLFEEMLSLRPGKEFERIRKPTMIEDVIPEGCGTRVSKVGDRIRCRIAGHIVATGDEFANTYDTVLTVGMSRGDFPDVLLREGLEGLCPGSKRRMAFPAVQAYDKEFLPPGVAPDSKVVFRIEMIGFTDEAPDTSNRGATLGPTDSDDASNPPEEL